MNIYFFSPSLTKGGAENQLVKVALYFKRQNHNVCIFTFVKGNDFQETLKNNKVPLILFDLKSLGGFISIVRKIKREKPSVLISFMFSANILVRLIKIFHKVPIITSVRANKVKKRLYETLYKLTYKLDDISTFNSKYSYDNFLKKKLSIKERSFIVNNAIYINDNVVKVDYEIQSKLNLISIAHFRDSKDYMTIFKAIKILKDRKIPVNLKILGHLYDNSWPIEIVRELDIANEVEFLGFVNKTDSYLINSDILILSSFLEGTPNAILEAMSKKVPVIASNIPGSKEIVAESNAGYLFEVESVDDLVNKILKIYKSSPEERKSMGDRGNIYIKNNYAEDKVMEKWSGLICKAKESVR